MGGRCSLCELQFPETAAYVVLDCGTCCTPMVVLREHVSFASATILLTMEVALTEAARERFEDSPFVIDKTRHEHLHWHARRTT